MQSQWFWKNWTKNFRWFWYILSGVFLFSLVLLWVNYVKDVNGSIHWNKIQEQKVLESTVHSFHVGPFELTVPAENFLIQEYFNGSEIEISKFGWSVFTFVLVFSAVLLLTIFTTLERFWYFAGVALFIVFVVSLRLDVLSIFGQRNQIPTITILICFTSISYYFQAFNKSATFVTRLLVLMLMTAVTAIVIYFFAWVPYPILHLAVTGYSAALIITVLFTLMVAHEIPAALVYIASQGTTKNLRHFLIVSVIYILNVIITALHELNVIHWNFVYTNLYLLISISIILGVWGFRNRENLYENIFSFSPYGAYFYMALASICFVTIAQLLNQANDPAIQIVRDIIIFSHVGYGVMFLLYVFSNFVLMLAQNLPVHKVLYKSNRMPYFTFRFAGLITTLGFVFYSGWHQYVYNGIAGFYNDIGDLYALLDKSATAEAYYEQGKNYGFANNHANYALAKLKVARYNLAEAHKNYESANSRRPNAFSLVNEGNLFYWENNPRAAIEAYRHGIALVNDAGEILNNLGFAYGKLRNLDSVVYHLNQARTYKNSKSSAEANFIAIAGLEYLPIKCDSVLKIFDNPYDATLANALAVATIQQQPFETKVDVLASKHLNLYSATLLNNYIVRNAKTLDTAFVKEANRIASDSLNSDYREALKASLAFVYYHQGNVSKALEVLGELAFLSQSYQGKYNYIMGLWALEQNNPALAASYFKYAMDADYKEGRLYYAIALTESLQQNEAMIAWDTVARSKEEGMQAMAKQIQTVLTTTAGQVQQLDDANKYQYCRYKIKLGDTIVFKNIVRTIINQNYKAQALLDMTTKLVEAGLVEKAIPFFNQIGGMQLTDKNLYEKVQHMELLMLAERKELRSLAKQINKGITFNDQYTLEKIYYTALLNEAANDTLNATKNFNIIAHYNPYFEQGIIAAADYFRIHSKDKMKAYNILVEAIHVNNNSPKLLRAYAGEAMRMNFTDYAFSAMQRVEELERAMR